MNSRLIMYGDVKYIAVIYNYYTKVYLYSQAKLKRNFALTENC